jgi:hypothetical protein
VSTETDSIFDLFARGEITEEERDEAIDLIAARGRSWDEEVAS